MKPARTVVALIALLAVSPRVYAATFNEMVLFGDSSLDVGNFGRFTNGPVWGEYLATELNLPAPRVSLLGDKLCLGRARTGFGIDNNPITGTLVPTVGKQIDDYLSRKPGRFEAHHPVGKL